MQNFILVPVMKKREQAVLESELLEYVMKQLFLRSSFPLNLKGKYKTGEPALNQPDNILLRD